jgi:hypothetical protein
MSCNALEQHCGFGEFFQRDYPLKPPLFERICGQLRDTDRATCDLARFVTVSYRVNGAKLPPIRCSFSPQHMHRSVRKSVDMSVHISRSRAASTMPARRIGRAAF